MAPRGALGDPLRALLRAPPEFSLVVVSAAPFPSDERRAPLQAKRRHCVSQAVEVTLCASGPQCFRNARSNQSCHPRIRRVQSIPPQAHNACRNQIAQYTRRAARLKTTAPVVLMTPQIINCFPNDLRGLLPRRSEPALRPGRRSSSCASALRASAMPRAGAVLPTEWSPGRTASAGGLTTAVSRSAALRRHGYAAAACELRLEG